MDTHAPAPPPRCRLCRHPRSTDSGDGTWRCEACGFEMRSDAWAELELSPASRRDLPGYASFVPDHLRRVRVTRTRARRIAAALGPLPSGAPPAVLDVGAGTATLASAWPGPIRYVGLEPDPVFRRAVPPGIRVLPDPVESARFEPDSFDAVVFADVLEHLMAPREALVRARTWLRPGGLVYVEVPDESGRHTRNRLQRALQAWNRNPGQHPTHPAHLSLFTPRTLHGMLARSGLAAPRVYPVSVWGDAERLALTLSLPRPLLRGMARGIGGVGLDRRLGFGALVGLAHRWRG